MGRLTCGFSFRPAVRPVLNLLHGPWCGDLLV